MAILILETKKIEKLQQAMIDFQGDTEKTINEVFHGEAAGWIQDSIQRFMPVSGRQWKGKRPAAKTANSLKDRDKTSNLSVTVGTKPDWNYLYFPDDGTNTRKHAGNQQFFKRGGEAVSGKIVDRCVEKLINNF